MKNPYADERGMPIEGKLSEFYDWMKSESDKEFNKLSKEDQEEQTKIIERFHKKMNS